MARYNYYCPKCDEVTEEVHGMTEEPEVKCEECGTVKERRIGGSGTIFFFPGIVGRWMEDNYEKYRGGRLTKADETKVKEPSHGYQGGAKDYKTRS